MSTDSHDDCGAPLGIGAAAGHLGVSAEALRYYETEGLGTPARDGSGHRRYGQRDLDALHVVVTMRAAGFGMAAIRRLIAVKTDAPPAVLVARARQALCDCAADVQRRQRALNAAQDLLRRWLSELDSVDTVTERHTV